MEDGAFGVTSVSPRKVKFKPKVPVRKTPKAVETKKELLPDADAEAAQTRELLRRVNEGSKWRGLKVERQSEPVQVAFGHVNNPMAVRTYGRNSSSGSTSRIQGSVSDDNQILPLPKRNKDYVEPWNYYSYYPVTLPLRMPHSGNPELRDEEEFGEASENCEYNEDSISPAAELGLMEDCEAERMLFLQLPASLPMAKRPPSIKGKEIAGTSRNVGLPEKVHGLDELPPGFVGKMQVYKSGAIKLKLGEIIYDVSPGSDCTFVQNVAAMNTKEMHCCDLGELDKRLIITPNIDSLLN